MSDIKNKCKQSSEDFDKFWDEILNIWVPKQESSKEPTIYIEPYDRFYVEYNFTSDDSKEAQRLYQVIYNLTNKKPTYFVDIKNSDFMDIRKDRVILIIYGDDSKDRIPYSTFKFRYDFIEANKEVRQIFWDHLTKYLPTVDRKYREIFGTP